MIEQQYYTRERRGIFSSTPGYDTIARSSGLDDSFIKNVLHPYCVYEAPSGLTGNSGSDKSIYPDCFTFFTSDSGRAVVGRSCFAGADFTGMRDTYFVHNLVFDENQSNELMKVLQRVFSIDIFQDKYNMEQGQELDKIENISKLNMSDQDRLLNFNMMLKLVGIDGNIFRKMVLAAFKSTINKKRIYISLDVPYEKFSNAAKSIMKYIIYTLPANIRRRTGFSTFSPYPKNRKNINIMFIEKGGIRLNDPEVMREYIFDIPRGRYYNVDFNDKSSYVEFIMDCFSRDDYGSLNKLHGNINSLPDIFTGNGEFSLDLADNLLNISNLLLSPQSEVNFGNDISGILNLSNRLAQKSGYYYTVVNQLLEHLKKSKINPAETKALIDIYRDLKDNSVHLDGHKKSARGNILQIFASELSHIGNIDRHSSEMLDQIKCCNELFPTIVAILKEKNSRLLDEYMCQEIETARNVDSIEKEIEFWKRYNYQNDGAIFNACKNVVTGSITILVERKKIILLLGKWGIDDTVAERLNKYIFNLIGLLSRISIEDVKATGKEELVSAGDAQHAKAILILKMIDESCGGIDNSICGRIADLDAMERQELNRAIRRLFFEGINKDYSKLVYSFLNYGSRVNNLYNDTDTENVSRVISCKLDISTIRQMVDYVNSSSGPEQVIGFIEFLRSQKLKYELADSSLHNALLEFKTENPDLDKQFVSTLNPIMKELVRDNKKLQVTNKINLKEVERGNKNQKEGPYKKSKSKKKDLLSLVIIFLLGFLGMLVAGTAAFLIFGGI